MSSLLRFIEKVDLVLNSEIKFNRSVLWKLENPTYTIFQESMKDYMSSKEKIKKIKKNIFKHITLLLDLDSESSEEINKHFRKIILNLDEIITGFGILIDEFFGLSKEKYEMDPIKYVVIGPIKNQLSLLGSLKEYILRLLYKISEVSNKRTVKDKEGRRYEIVYQKSSLWPTNEDLLGYRTEKKSNRIGMCVNDILKHLQYFLHDYNFDNVTNGPFLLPRKNNMHKYTKKGLNSLDKRTSRMVFYCFKKSEIIYIRFCEYITIAMHNKALSNTTKCEFRYNKISQDHCINNDGIYWTDYNGWIIVEFINDL